ncbi:MAG: hypothetical protein M3044_01720 [Thermoproteota archaeon]|nr:hypothetical protein [Thermoproteota archaeon]
MNKSIFLTCAIITTFAVTIVLPGLSYAHAAMMLPPPRTLGGDNINIGGGGVGVNVGGHHISVDRCGVNIGSNSFLARGCGAVPVPVPGPAQK